jgi:hypothetical protein
MAQCLFFLAEQLFKLGLTRPCWYFIKYDCGTKSRHFAEQLFKLGLTRPCCCYTVHYIQYWNQVSPADNSLYVLKWVFFPWPWQHIHIKMLLLYRHKHKHTQAYTYLHITHTTSTHTYIHKQTHIHQLWNAGLPDRVHCTVCAEGDVCCSANGGVCRSSARPSHFCHLLGDRKGGLPLEMRCCLATFEGLLCILTFSSHSLFCFLGGE